MLPAICPSIGWLTTRPEPPSRSARLLALASVRPAITTSCRPARTLAAMPAAMLPLPTMRTCMGLSLVSGVLEEGAPDHPVPDGPVLARRCNLPHAPRSSLLGAAVRGGVG